MSPIRQSAQAEQAIAVRSLPMRLPPSCHIDSHQHPWGQVLYATEGAMTVSTEQGAWVVPTHRAAWLAPGTAHDVRTTGSVRLRTVYLRPDLAVALPSSSCVLSVSPLLRELILETVRCGMLRDDRPEERRLARVLVDQIRSTPQAPLELVWPRDPRALRVARAVQADLESSAPLTALAKGSGASVRTIERVFLKETGRTFRRWRQQAKLLEALERLASGESVTAAGLAVGFSSTSAFISMFRQALGTTPGSYFREASVQIDIVSVADA